MLEHEENSPGVERDRTGVHEDVVARLLHDAQRPPRSSTIHAAAQHDIVLRVVSDRLSAFGKSENAAVPIHDEGRNAVCGVTTLPADKDIELIELLLN
jgi:hypothetical protein